MPKSTKVAQIHLPECNSAKRACWISTKIRQISAKFPSLLQTLHEKLSQCVSKQSLLFLAKLLSGQTQHRLTRHSFRMTCAVMATLAIISELHTHAHPNLRSPFWVGRIMTDQTHPNLQRGNDQPCKLKDKRNRLHLSPVPYKLTRVSETPTPTGPGHLRPVIIKPVGRMFEISDLNPIRGKRGKCERSLSPRKNKGLRRFHWAKTRKMAEKRIVQKMRLTGFNVIGFRWPPTGCLKGMAVQLPFVRQYAPHWYRWTFLASKPWRKGNPTVHLPLGLQ